jgi:hypothetical protein
MWQLFRAVISIAIMFVLGNFALGFCAHTAWSQGIGLKEMAEFAKEQNAKKSPELVLNQEEIDQLRMFKKEIAKLQYSELCATMVRPPAHLIKQLDAVATANPENKEVLEAQAWLHIADQIIHGRCGDA